MPDIQYKLTLQSESLNSGPYYVVTYSTGSATYFPVVSGSPAYLPNTGSNATVVITSGSYANLSFKLNNGVGGDCELCNNDVVYIVTGSAPAPPPTPAPTTPAPTTPSPTPAPGPTPAPTTPAPTTPAPTPSECSSTSWRINNSSNPYDVYWSGTNCDGGPLGGTVGAFSTLNGTGCVKDGTLTYTGFPIVTVSAIC
jgi:hypothetical protein